MSQILFQQPSTFYDHVLEWELLEELLEQFEEQEKHTAHQEMAVAIDHAIHHAILDHLPIEHHTVYLDMCRSGVHEMSILEWLEIATTHENIIALIQETYITVYAQLKTRLSIHQSGLTTL